MWHKAEAGSSDSSKFAVSDDLGRLANPMEAIVPICKQSEQGWRLIGTGFYISTNGILASAKHVLTSVFSQGKQTGNIVCFHFEAEGRYLIRPLTWGYTHNSADVGLALGADATHNKSGSLLQNKILRLSKKPLNVGDSIFTYAYPATLVEPGPPQKITFSPRFYEGTVEEVLSNGRDKMMPGPCYRSSLVVHGGASGGPVFNDEGLVVGINCTAIDFGSGAPEVSYLSWIHPVLEMTLPKVRLSDTEESHEISVARLAELGHVVFV